MLAASMAARPPPLRRNDWHGPPPTTAAVALSMGPARNTSACIHGLLVLKTDERRTVTVALTELSTRTQAATLSGPLFAGFVLATLPTIVLFFVFQRRLTQGILSGAVRG